MTTLRLDRLSISNGGLTSTSRPSMRPNIRAGSPVGGSILMTSAPQSARMPPVAGPATQTPSSTTLMPSIGPAMPHTMPRSAPRDARVVTHHPRTLRPMSMVTGHGPLSSAPAGWFSPKVPAQVVYVEPHPRRVQAAKNGRTVIDTEHALRVHPPDRPLSYAFPADEIIDLPTESVSEAPGFVHVPWDAVDTWTEEGRTLVHYPPNPYHRIDCRPTKRRLRVGGAGTP